MAMCAGVQTYHRPIVMCHEMSTDLRIALEKIAVNQDDDVPPWEPPGAIRAV